MNKNMKIRILTLALVLMSTWSWSQTNGGELSGRTVSGTRKAVGVDSTAPNRAALRVKDSTLIATLSTLNGKIPSNLTVTSTRLLVDGSGVTQPTSFTRLKASTDTVAISGSISATAGATAIYDSARTAVALDTAGLAAKANSATVGWQSDTVGLRQHKVTDMKLGVKISFANTAPANDKALYIYACPWWYDGTTWYAGSQGTTTLPTGANGTTTIASPNDLVLLGVLSYTTQNMICQKQFMLSNAFGQTMPDAVSFIIVNYTGAAIHTSGNLLYYSLTQRTQR